METKTCENCDAQIGKDEVKCPKCGVTFDELEDAVTTVERAQQILAKRKLKNTPVPTPAPTPAPAVPGPEVPKQKTSIFSSLGKVIRNK